MISNHIGVCATCVLCASARELVQVQFVHRHGDRAPLTTLPDDPIDWEEELGTSKSQLTGLGMTQAYNFGTWLRTRYMKEKKLLNPNYLASEVYVRSTDLDRTLMTANIILQSLFRNATRYDEINGQTWDTLMRVPVHTVQLPNNVLQAVDICPKYLHEKLPELYQTEEWQTKEQEEADFIARFKQETGFKDVQLKTFYHYYDPVYVQHVHNLDHNPWLEANLDHIVELADFSETRQKNSGGSLVGGPFLYRFAESMRIAVAGHSDAQKYIQYSGHDSTVMAVLSALGIFTLPQLNQIPPYASAIILELYKETTGNYTVDVLFRDGVTGNVSLIEAPQSVPHAYPDFLSMLESRGLSDTEWCKVCVGGTDHWIPESAPDVCIRNDLSNVSDQTHELDQYRAVAIAFVCAFVLALGAVVFLLVRARSLAKQRRSDAGLSHTLLGHHSQQQRQDVV